MIEIHERDTATMASIRGEAAETAQGLLKGIQESGYRMGLLRGQQNYTETRDQRDQLLQTVTDLLEQVGLQDAHQDQNVILRAERLAESVRGQLKHNPDHAPSSVTIDLPDVQDLRVLTGKLAEAQQESVSQLTKAGGV
jgi:hypothetical protein